jgi:23S rRNA (adenine2030-N6)-methyltransferase
MNYDHAFHAGNFADVVKHVVLVRILLYLQRKEAPFRVIDTHAGAGRYDLASAAAVRTGEWREGVGRLSNSAFSAEACDLIRPYLDVVGAAANGAAPYPGSPAIALALTRPVDRLLFCDLHPRALAQLRTVVGGDRRAKVMALDGYVGLKAFVPPVERRGLVLIDPPFESPDEFDRLAEALLRAYAKWPGGTYLAWYPIKDLAAAQGLASKLVTAGVRDMLCVEWGIGRPSREGPLVASGLLMIHPPFTLETELTCLLPELQRQLAADDGFWRVNRLAAREP